MGNVRKHVFVIFAVLIFLTGETGAAEKDAKILSERARIIVYYFHGTYTVALHLQK
jgi:hypothetical protein